MAGVRTKDRILGLLADGEARTATELAGMLGISRQAVSKHLRGLIASGGVIKTGATKGARFRLAKPGEAAPTERRFAKRLLLEGLEEDQVFSDIAARLSLREGLSPEAFAIVNHAFTEILNNAVEHSGSAYCHLDFVLDTHDVRFDIRDFGIGVFHSIQSKFDLEDEDAAVAELLKGKATTMAERHSGEGLFFTSKVADRFVLRSHLTTVLFRSGGDDIHVEEGRLLEGTDAQFAVSARSRRKLDAVFRQYAPEEFDYKFEKTRVLVRIQAGECISRSEAKRLVARLENFREVALDFTGVTALGQAFADEVFRVFVRANPALTLRLMNLRPTLRPLVEHVLDARSAGRVSFLD